MTADVIAFAQGFVLVCLQKASKQIRNTYCILDRKKAAVRNQPPIRKNASITPALRNTSHAQMQCR